jgi:hypothetical protein
MEERLDRLFEAYWQATLELNPVMATFIGDHRFNDRYPVDIAPEHRVRERALLERNLAAAAAIPAGHWTNPRRLSRELSFETCARISKAIVSQVS